MDGQATIGTEKDLRAYIKEGVERIRIRTERHRYLMEHPEEATPAEVLDILQCWYGLQDYHNALFHSGYECEVKHPLLESWGRAARASERERCARIAEQPYADAVAAINGEEALRIGAKIASAIRRGT